MLMWILRWCWRQSWRDVDVNLDMMLTWILTWCWRESWRDVDVNLDVIQFSRWLGRISDVVFDYNFPAHSQGISAIFAYSQQGEWRFVCVARVLNSVVHPQSFFQCHSKFYNKTNHSAARSLNVICFMPFFFQTCEKKLWKKITQPLVNNTLIGPVFSVNTNLALATLGSVIQGGFQAIRINRARWNQRLYSFSRSKRVDVATEVNRHAMFW